MTIAVPLPSSYVAKTGGAPTGTGDIVAVPMGAVS
jgi:hypothetical protein